MRDVLAVYDPGRGVRQILPFAAAGYRTLEQFAVAPPEPRRLEGLAIAIVMAEHDKAFGYGKD